MVTVGTNAAYAQFGYDLSGNMTARVTPSGGMTLTWDGLNQLRVADGPHGRELYFYDHTGARLFAISQVEGIKLWFGESETHYSLQGGQTRRYLHLGDGGGSLARVEDKGKIELQFADALQNLMLATDAAGNVVASFLYGPFGEVVANNYLPRVSQS